MNNVRHCKYHLFLIYAALAVATVGVYWGVWNHDFVNYDDTGYVRENVNVAGGLTSEGIRWAFTTGHYGNWHPLTWLSHMLDCQLFGVRPGWHHLTNLLLHVASTLVLFWVLKEMTAAVWPSAFVAAAFALHPAHVESVAWISERKDVLSGLFWMLTMAGYLLYVRRPSVWRYALTIVAFGLGLMAKPMLVTLPFVLLLLDYWPLERFSRKCVLEKVPMFVLTAGSCLVTFFVQRGAGAVAGTHSIAPHIRTGNAIISYVAYIWKMVWPRGLAVFYPHSLSISIGMVAGAAAILFGLSVMFIWLGRKKKYLLTGWLWYLGTLVPVIGLVQVGSQGMADRYTYVPYIGLFIIVAWSAVDLLAAFKYRRVVLISAGVIVLSGLGVCAHLQQNHWRDSRALFEHAMSVTEGNYIAHFCMAEVLEAEGKADEAIAQYNKALEILPDYVDAHNRLGIALGKLRRFDEATMHLKAAVAINQDFAEAHSNLGVVLAMQGDLDGAIRHFSESLRIQPGDVTVQNNLRAIIAKRRKLLQENK